MENIQPTDLLQIWAEHQPDRCTRTNTWGTDGYRVLNSAGEWWGVITPPDEIGKAWIVTALIHAIELESLTMRAETATLEGITNYFITLFHIDTGRYSRGHDREFSIALLRAYVNWLQIRHLADGYQAVANE